MSFADIAASALPIIGGAVGSLVGPVGTAAGTALGSYAGGAIMSGQADKLKKDAQAEMDGIPLNDPGQMARMGDLDRRASALLAGTDAMTSNQAQQIRANTSQTQANLVRSGRGSQSDLLRAQSISNRGIGQVGAQSRIGGYSLLQQAGAMEDGRAKRAYDRQLSSAHMMWQEFARKREDGNRQMMASIGLAGEVDWGGLGKKVPVGGPTGTENNG